MFVLFADDTALINSFSNAITAENEINNDLKILSQWSRSWMIKFNPTKTKFIIFSNKKEKTKSHLRLLLNNSPLEQVKCSKHLGILFSEDLRWSDHINFLAKKQIVKSVFCTEQGTGSNEKTRLIFSLP